MIDFVSIDDIPTILYALLILLVTMLVATITTLYDLTI